MKQTLLTSSLRHPKWCRNIYKMLKEAQRELKITQERKSMYQKELYLKNRKCPWKYPIINTYPDF